MSRKKSQKPRKHGMSAEDVLAMHSERSPDGCRLWTGEEGSDERRDA